MFDTNILRFQDVFHVTLLEILLQQPVHSMHNSGTGGFLRVVGKVLFLLKLEEGGV